jgi:hypothetical protein
MTGRQGHRILGVLTGALLGYGVGWIWGWSLFDPNSDIWALTALLGAIVGLIVGFTRWFWEHAGKLTSGALGLYVGWIFRTWLLGDEPGGFGLAIMIVGMVVGAGIWARLGARNLGGILGILYLGFFGGFLIDVVILDLIAGWVQQHGILSQAPAVFACGVVGWLLGKRIRMPEHMGDGGELREA